MTTQSTTKEKFQAEFESLPLEDKYATLFKLEAAALKETLNVFMDSSKEFFDKATVAVNDFGSKFEGAVTDVYSKVECEVKAETKSAEAKDEPKAKKTSTKKTTAE
jgi:hypothetical protein